MKINNLTINNLKKVKDIKITTGGKNIIILEGKNAQGKTSVMDSISYALGGARLIPDCPVRHGQETAEIVVELDDYIVKRRWLKSGSSALEVKSKDGVKVKSAQTILDEIIGELSFDPMEFCQRTKAERVTILKEIAKLDFTDLDKEYNQVFDDRTFHYRNVRNLKAELEKYKDISMVVLDDIKEVQNARNGAAAINRETEKRRLDHLVLGNNITELSNYTNELHEQIEALKEKHFKVCQEVSAKLEIFNNQIEEINNLEIIDLMPFDKIIAEHSEKSALNERYKIKVDTENKLQENEELAQGLTDRLNWIRNEKIRLINASNMPVNGLSFDKDVTYQDVEFEQISYAEKIKISMAIAMALNPKLKVIRIMNGSLLDSDTFKEIERIADEKDFQVWIEKISESHSGGNAFFIEDGEIIN